MSKSEWEDWFEQAWKYREETAYPRLFGAERRGIFVLSPDIFIETFKQETFDPRWLTFGILEFSPTDQRQSWLYVTSGMSNAWEDEMPNPDGPSGFGCEFVFETAEQGEWPILRLQHLMAFQILLFHGKYPGRDPLSPYDRIPLRSSITPEPSELQWLILAPPESYSPRFELASGWVDLYAVFGATELETKYAREEGGEKLVEILKQSDAFPATDPKRKCSVHTA